jgi:hypothetical protein
MQYLPPTPEDLDRLKTDLGFSSSQMAELFGLATGRQWRRYTSQADDPKNRRDMGMHMLFFAVARLELSAAELDRVLTRMRRAGASIDLSESAGEPQP